MVLRWPLSRGLGHARRDRRGGEARILAAHSVAAASRVLSLQHALRRHADLRSLSVLRRLLQRALRIVDPAVAGGGGGRPRSDVPAVDAGPGGGGRNRGRYRAVANESASRELDG